MSRTRNYRPETISAMQRYFDAIDALQEQGKITINGYCTENEIDRRHWYEQKKDLTRGFFEIYWIMTLQKYKVNLKYIMFGTGQMFV